MHIFLLSRFNPVQRRANSRRHNRTHRMEARRFDEEWQERRIILMRHFTAPSVKAQTDHNFSWYVFVQDGTPQHVFDRIEMMGANVIRVETDDVDAAQRIVRQSRGTIATVNLDTDDAIAGNFLERLRAEARPRDETLSFLRGMRYRPSPPWGVSTKSESNPFNARVEKDGSKAKTVFDFAHVKPDRVLDPRQMMWMQTIHGDNIDNIKLKRTKRDTNLAPEAIARFNIQPFPYYGR